MRTYEAYCKNTAKERGEIVRDIKAESKEAAAIEVALRRPELEVLAVREQMPLPPQPKDLSNAALVNALIDGLLTSALDDSQISALREEIERRLGED